MKYLYLLRHGQTGVSERGKKRQKDESELSEIGRMQAATQAQRLPNDIDFLFSSKILRAAQTAKIVAERKGLNLQYLDILREIDRPDFIHGASYNDPLHQKYMRERTRAIAMGEMNWRYEDQGESFLDLYYRCLEIKLWLNDPRFEGKKIAFEGHSNSHAMLAAVLTSDENSRDPNALKYVFESFKTSFLKYGGIAIFISDNSNIWNLVYLEKKPNKKPKK